MAEPCSRCGGSGIQPGHEIWDYDGRLRGPACRECGGRGTEHVVGDSCLITALAKVFVFVVLPIFALLVLRGLYINLTQDDDNPIEATAEDPTEGIKGERVGSCLQGIRSDTITVVDCSAAHEAEVYRLVGIDADQDAARPSQADLTDFARDECREAVVDYLGSAPVEEGLSANWLAPSDEGWAKGRRTVTCLLLQEDGSSSTGRVRGTGG